MTVSFLAVLIGASLLTFIAIAVIVALRRRALVTPSINDPRPWALHALVLSVWAYSLVPSLLSIARDGRSIRDVTADAALSGVSSVASRVLFLATTLLCLLTILRYIKVVRARAVSTLMAFVAPWVVMEMLALQHSSPQPAVTILYPLIAIALWVGDLRIDSVMLFGRLTVATACISLVLAWFTPLGTVHSVGFDDKALFGEGLLAGPYAHPNALGLALVLGLPAVFEMRKKRWVVCGVIAISFALVWSASRTALGAAGVVLALRLLLPFLNDRWRGRCTVVALAAGMSLVLLVPVLDRSASAFSERGQIWLASLALWKSSPISVVFGHGPDIYTVVARYDSNFGLLAFHGHNLVVHFLLVGGLVMLAVVVCLLLLLSRLAMRAFRRGALFPVLTIVCFIFASILELITDFRVPSSSGLVAWLGLGFVAFGQFGADKSDRSIVGPSISEPLVSSR